MPDLKKKKKIITKYGQRGPIVLLKKKFKKKNHKNYLA